MRHKLDLLSKKVGTDWFSFITSREMLVWAVCPISRTMFQRLRFWFEFRTPSVNTLLIWMPLFFLCGPFTSIARRVLWKLSTSTATNKLQKKNNKQTSNDCLALTRNARLEWPLTYCLGTPNGPAFGLLRCLETGSSKPDYRLILD